MDTPRTDHPAAPTDPSAPTGKRPRKSRASRLGLALGWLLLAAYALSWLTDSDGQRSSPRA